MHLSADDLDDAVAAGILTREQADRLAAHLSALQSSSVKPKFDFVHVAYYFGALIVIAAMGFFMTLGWERFGGGGIFAIAAGYTVAFVLAGRALWRRELKIPGGLLITMAVCMTPLATYGLERALGLWPDTDPGSFRDFHVWVKSGWLFMEIETLIAGLLAIKFVRFPFLTAPIAFTLWYMSMDLAPMFFTTEYPTTNERALVSAAVGALTLVFAYVIDRRTKEDFAFWLYLFGMMAFWGGLSSMNSDSQLMKFGYCLLNIGFMIASVLLERRVLLVFGALGVFGYLGYLSWHVFENSLAFPFVLSFIGLAVIFGAVQYARRRARIDAALFKLVPAPLARALPRSRVR
jgi:hypothetical protein